MNADINLLIVGVPFHYYVKRNKHILKSLFMAWNSIGPEANSVNLISFSIIYFSSFKVMISQME